MIGGLFDLPTAKAPLALIPHCGACGLFRNCQSPKMPPTGRGRRKVLIVGESSTENDDARGNQFENDGFFASVLENLDFDLHKDAIVTNSVICRSHTNGVDRP